LVQEELCSGESLVLMHYYYGENRNSGEVVSGLKDVKSRGRGWEKRGGVHSGASWGKTRGGKGDMLRSENKEAQGVK